MRGAGHAASMGSLQNSKVRESKHFRTQSELHPHSTVPHFLIGLVHNEDTTSSEIQFPESYQVPSTAQKIEIVPGSGSSNEISTGLERFYTTYSVKHKRSDSVESQVLYENKVLEDKLENAMRNNHQLENQLEQVQTHMKQSENGTKNVNKKYRDLKEKLRNVTKENEHLKGQLEKAEDERYKMSEKWVKSSSKNKQEFSKCDFINIILWVCLKHSNSYLFLNNFEACEKKFLH
jgi:hypothetical protein